MARTESQPLFSRSKTLHNSWTDFMIWRQAKGCLDKLNLEDSKDCPSTRLQD